LTRKVDEELLEEKTMKERPKKGKVGGMH